MSDEITNLSYEQAKHQLDEVVAQLEDKDLPLDDMVTLWEKGERLATVCEERLAGARARLEAVKPDAQSS